MSSKQAAAAVICLWTLICPCLGSVRLVGGQNAWEGRLEVLYNGQWGTVCDDHFDVDDAKVVCRMLNYTRKVPIVRPLAHYGQGSGPIWLDDLACTGKETDVFQCSDRGLGNHSCAHYEDVGVDCKPPMQIRLVGGGRPSAGRVEINIGGRWGTLCDDSFDHKDTDKDEAICSFLGYANQTPKVYPRSYYGPGSGLIWIDNFDCSANKMDLEQCLSPDDSHTCHHTEDVGVDCQPWLDPPKDPPILEGVTANDSFLEGSSVTLRCTVPGGKPLVSDVDIVCSNQERAIPAVETLTVEDNSVSKNITIQHLEASDDGAVCECRGVWTPQPNLYTLQSATITLHVLESKESSRILIYVGCGVGAIVIVVIVVVVVIIMKRRGSADRLLHACHDKTPGEDNPNYTSLATPDAQTQENVYDSLSVGHPYVNVP